MWEGQATEEPRTQAYTLAQPSPAQRPRLPPTPPWANSWHLPGCSFLSLALSGAVDRRAHGKEEKTEGERDEKSEGKGEDYRVFGEVLGKVGNRGEEYPT